jgi:pSer/pThr/pTyr-binding forkhead associated (FHA) protein/RNA polymerase subunit RPABC4/transcription elongation factor Spt4
MAEDYVGIACGRCDTFTPMGGPRCVECGHELLVEAGAGVLRDGAEEPSAAGETSAGAQQSPTVDPAATPQEEPMEQARNFVCKECFSPVPSGHKFCGACGAPVPQEVQDLRTDYFGPMQAPGKARLILIRGDQGVDGLSYLLQGNEHWAGREDAQILFPDDKWVSPRHANFLYRGEKLVVRDEGSTNGVYVRLRGPVTIEPGGHFLCGEQVMRLDLPAKDSSGPDSEGTHFYSSPKRPSPFRLTQILKGGAEGLVFCARENTATLGREECDVNFPEDLFISGNHCSVAMSGDGKFTLKDEGSKNGTFIRIQGEQELSHGDYLFLGHQLLRVEMTA